MTTEHDTQQKMIQRYMDIEAALTPVVINRLVKSGAMTPTHAAELKSAHRKKQARKHTLKHQAKKRAEQIKQLHETETALVCGIGMMMTVVHDAKLKMDTATHHHTQVSTELTTQQERLAAVRRRIAKLQNKIQNKTTPSANVPSPAAPAKTPKKKTTRKRTPYNMFVKLESAAIREALGDDAKVRGATMKEAGKRWKELSTDERIPYKTAADQHNAKMAADQQNQQAT